MKFNLFRFLWVFASLALPLDSITASDGPSQTPFKGTEASCKKSYRGIPGPTGPTGPSGGGGGAITVYGTAKGDDEQFIATNPSNPTFLPLNLAYILEDLIEATPNAAANLSLTGGTQLQLGLAGIYQVNYGIDLRAADPLKPQLVDFILLLNLGGAPVPFSELNIFGPGLLHTTRVIAIRNPATDTLSLTYLATYPDPKNPPVVISNPPWISVIRIADLP